jgi:hypothetical protein
MTRPPNSILAPGIGRAVSAEDYNYTLAKAVCASMKPGRAVTVIDEVPSVDWNPVQALGIPKRQRKPSHKTALDQAKKAGAASLTTPDGFTYTFERPANSEANPWDKVLPDAANKKRPT